MSDKKSSDTKQLKPRRAGSFNLTPAAMFTIFCVGAITLLPLRTYQLLTITEGGTGFYTSENFTVWVMYALMAVFAFLPYILARAAKNNIHYDTTQRRRTAEAVLHFLLSAALIYDTVVRYINFNALYFEYSRTYHELSMAEYLTKSGATAMLAEAVFAVIASTYFLLAGIACLTPKGKSRVRDYKFLALTPLAWCICRIIHRFMRTISFTKVADLFIELVMLVFLMSFLLSLAHVNSNLSGREHYYKLYGFGISSALFCLLCFVPRIVVIVVGRGSLLAEQSPPEPCDLAMAALIIATLLSRAGVVTGGMTSGESYGGE